MRWERPQGLAGRVVEEQGAEKDRIMGWSGRNLPLLPSLASQPLRGCVHGLQSYGLRLPRGSGLGTPHQAWGWGLSGVPLLLSLERCSVTQLPWSVFLPVSALLQHQRPFVPSSKFSAAQHRAGNWGRVEFIHSFVCVWPENEEWTKRGFPCSLG